VHLQFFRFSSILHSVFISQTPKSIGSQRFNKLLKNIPSYTQVAEFILITFHIYFREFFASLSFQFEKFSKSQKSIKKAKLRGKTGNEIA
jgi:uncharacterized membrane protein YwzB